MTQILAPGYPWHHHRVMFFEGQFDTQIEKGGDYKTLALADIFTLEPTDRPKERAPACFPSSYCKKDGRVHAVQREHGVFGALCGDVDKGDHSLEAIEGLVHAFCDGTAYLIFGSAHSRPGDQRWRIVLPLQTPVAFDAWRDGQNGLFDFMDGAGVTMDRVMARPGQPVYLPNVPPFHLKSGTILRDLSTGATLYYQRATTGIDAPGLRLDAGMAGHYADAARLKREADEAAQAQAAAEAAARRAARGPDDEGGIIGAFNAAHAVSTLLEKYGYAHGGGDDYQSPHQQGGSFATRVMGDDDSWVSLSGSDDEAGVGAKSANGARYGDAFDLFVHYEHKNDRAAALAAARSQRVLAGFPTTAPSLPTGALAAPVPDPPTAVSVGPRERPAVMAPSQFGDYFKGVTYVNGRDEFFTPQGQFLKRSAFDGTYGGPTFMLGVAGTGPTKSPSDAFLKNETWPGPRANATCFRPERSPGECIDEEGFRLLNCYVPIEVERREGDVSRFLHQARMMIPNERDLDIMFHYLASMVQHKGRKFFWWPVLQGTRGNGKTMFISIMSYCMGNRYTHLVNPEAMVKTGNQFNDWIDNKLFIGIEEVRTKDARKDLLELLKPIVTNPRTPMEGKGLKQTTSDNRANGIACTNYQDALPIDDDERRYAIFFTAQQSAEDLIRDGMTQAYFRSLYNWLDHEGGKAMVYDWLMKFPLRAEFDPAQDAVRAPHTSSMQLAIAAGRGAIEQEILDAIEEGRPGFVGGLVNSSAVRVLIDKMRRNLPLNKVRALMQTLGYDWHPALPDGRCTVMIQGQFSGKPRLYAKKGSDIWKIATPAEVMDAYNALQAEGSLG